MSPSTMPMAQGMDAADPRPGPAHRAERLQQPGRRVIEARRARRILSVPPRWTARRTWRPTRRPTRSTHADQQQPAHGEQVDPANPRADNRFGHIIEMTPEAARRPCRHEVHWNVLVRCGDPAIAAVGATFHPNTTKDGWFGMPDNCAVDAAGRLWIATDGNAPPRPAAPTASGRSRRKAPPAARQALLPRPERRRALRPELTPDMETFFVAVQHPGEPDEDDPNSKPASFEQMSTRWPDFRPDLPARPSVVAITKKGGGKIGGVAGAPELGSEHRAGIADVKADRLLPTGRRPAVFVGGWRSWRLPCLRRAVKGPMRKSCARPRECSSIGNWTS